VCKHTGVELFPHNQTAYEAAIQRLSENGRAAVIHPTGTGKSFVAFNSFEKNKLVTGILWLSEPGWV